MLGREIYQLYHAYIEAALDGERTGFERQLIIAGRPPIWIHVDYYPDKSPQGSVRGFLVTYSDVDHLKRLELEAGLREHRLRLVTDSVGVPILYFDRQQKLRFANKPYAEWIGIAGRRSARSTRCASSCRRSRSPRCRATSSARSPARRSRTSARSARRRASCAGCATRCSRSARWAGASAARSS